jgi:tetratricopeptide (TPR) repeat protein
VFHAYYDDHPLGRAVLSNRLDRPLSDIRLSFFIKQYMDGPQDCPVPASLAPGESEEIQLYALFRPNILEVTEATKVQAEISLEYRVGAETGRRSFTHSLGVLDRNALTWEDDRRAAAFITAKDPVLLTFSKNVISAMRSSRVQGLNAQLLTALAIYEATNLRGLSYVPDPRGGYAQTSGKPEVDFLQFPRQTLEYKAGDCDDLSVLTCALLESVGIETAFITVPGHILMAFRLEMEPEEARQAFSRPDELILRSGQSWIPIEVTDRSGFLSAWQAGARQWRENLARGQVAFLPVHEAWKLYPPVGLPGAGTPPAAIGEEDVRKRAGAEIERFVTREIAPRALALEEQVRKAQDKRRPANELGVLYARYGLLERARAEFENILKGAEYLPALLNLANVLLLDGQKEQALACCQRAYAQDPGNPRVLLGLARVNHELENYFQARKAFEELKKKDPELSRRFAYLELRGEEAARAAEVGGLKEVILWEQ